MASSDVQPPIPSSRTTLYDVLGVGEDAGSQELTQAYRSKALAQHPDKGGDAAAFDELAKAYKVLDDSKKRQAYDEELQKARERALLVEGAPEAEICGTTAGVVSEKQAQAPMRAKTEPTPGSKRQGKLRTSQPGKPQCCAQEWKGMSSGANVLKALTDDVTAEQATEKLFEKYAALPRGKEKKREWVNGVRGQQKQDLKALAKKKEEQERAKWDKWLRR
mmetsp:Transcript_58929/g.140661  ORF Transcript_58929/g.140661 Transcript_58929/m.140661 type:complete len:220 (-) Transcript_58929:138-797(-)